MGRRGLYVKGAGFEGEVWGQGLGAGFKAGDWGQGLGAGFRQGFESRS